MSRSRVYGAADIMGAHGVPQAGQEYGDILQRHGLERTACAECSVVLCQRVFRGLPLT